MENQKLALTDNGSGMPVIFLHGFCEAKEMWKSFSDELQKHFRVICIDMPGFGENEALAKPHTIGDFADILYQTLQQINLEQFVLVGHSFGGYVSLAFAEKFPQRVRGLCLFHSTAYSDTLEKKQGRTKSIDFIERYGVNEFVQEVIPPLFFDGRKKDLKDEIKTMVDMGKNAHKSSVIETIKAMRDRKDRSKILDKAHYPVLFIAGRNDSAINFAASAGQFLLPANVTVKVLNNTGHMGMLERKDETLLTVSHFLSEVEVAH